MPLRPMNSGDEKAMVGNGGRSCPNQCTTGYDSDWIKRDFTIPKTLIMGDTRHIIVKCHCGICHERWFEAYALTYARTTLAEVSDAIKETKGG